MQRDILISWVQHFIAVASSDDNVPRRISRIKALQSVKKIISTFPKNVTTKIIEKSNLSEYMKKKLNTVVENAEPPPKSPIMELAEINGIGEVLAKKLYSRGITIDTIANHISELPLEAQMNIMYPPKKPIERAYIDRIDKLLKTYSIQYEIAGSYRRGKALSSDVDILYLGDPRDLAKLLPGRKHIYTIGPEKVSMIYSLPGSRIYTKLDIMGANVDNWVCYLLYLTGSREHNIMMRRRAKELNYLLNQNGLYRDGIPIEIKSEKEIFTILDIPYSPPNRR